MNMSQAALALELAQVVNGILLVRSQHSGTVSGRYTCIKRNSLASSPASSRERAQLRERKTKEINNGSRTFIPLYSEKKFAAVHPEKDEPENEEDDDAFEHRRIDCPEGVENVLTEVGADVVAHKSDHQLPHAIEGDRIEARDDEREAPAFPTAPFDNGNERAEKQRHEASAEQCPRRCPDALPDWAEAREIEHSANDESRHAEGDESFQFSRDS